MNINQSKTKTVYVLFIAIFSSTTTFAQFTCEIGKRNWFYQIKEDPIPDGEDFSGLAYHPTLEILFIPICEPVPPLNELMAADSISMRGYNLKDKNAFNVRFLDDKNALTGNDFEGISHLKDDYFALLEETENKIYFLKYMPNDKQFEVLNGHLTGIERVNTVSNTFGLAGISYDPNTGNLYVIDEYERKLYSAPLVWPGELLLDGSISTGFVVEQAFTDSSVNLGDNLPSSFHLATGLFHLGQIYPANHPLANHILVTSFVAPPPKTRTLIEFKISLDQNNDLSLDLIKEVDFETIKTTTGEVEFKPEGIVVTENTIYVASEWVGFSSYPKKSIGDRCTNGYYIYNEVEEKCECVACPSELWINTNAYNINEDNDEMSISGLYESVESIETVVTNSSIVDVIIYNNETVDLKSAHIKLNEGFKVETGACLNATIAPCE